MNITIHNKNNSIRSTTCFRKAGCSSAWVLFSMEDLTKLKANRTQIRSWHQPRYQGLLFSWLLKTRKFIWETNGTWIRLLIKNLVYFICLFVLLKQSNRNMQSTLFFIVFTINEAIALHFFFFFSCLNNHWPHGLFFEINTRERSKFVSENWTQCKKKVIA